MKEKHLIIDGPNLVHRAYWVSSMKNKTDTNFHLFVTLRSIKCLVEQFQPTKIWCAWDHRINRDSTAIRKANSAEYKGTRDQSKNKEVHEKTDTLIELLKLLDINNIQPLRGEADDIMAHIAREEVGDKVIVTADHDLLQLINSETSVWSPIKKKLYDVKRFTEDFGMSPTRFAYYKSIIGDKSDNIEGLYKFGNKKALRVVKGEIVLTEEQENKVAENMKLISLAQHNDEEWQEEYAYYDEALDNVEMSADFNSFITMCDNLDLDSISHNQSTWHSLFFMKSTMENVLFQLFKD